GTTQLIWIVVAAAAAVILSRYVDHAVPVVFAVLVGAAVPHKYGPRVRAAIAIMCGLTALFVARMWVTDEVPEGPPWESRAFLSWLLRVPFLAAIAVLFIPRQSHKFLRGFTFVTMIGTLAMSLVLLRVPMGHEYHFNQDYVWIPSFGIHYH